VPQIKEERSAYRNLVGNLSESDHLEHFDENWIILE
jgi:hypothetical protein